MTSFAHVYQRLNNLQKQAVDYIDGPLLVIAGPGTGKTQLLSARVANILQKTDTLAQNILCLTFTEAAALNMRERLSTMIQDDAYDVHISTYHSFASDIIKSYPDYFNTVDLETGADSRMERPINELGQLEIIRKIVDELPFTDPMRSSKYFIKSVVSTISDLKQANLKPSDLSQIASENFEVCNKLSAPIHDVFSVHKRMPSKADQAISTFSQILDTLQSSDSSLAVQAAKELEQAINDAGEANSTKPLTAWKNQWLVKDESDNWTFTDPATSQKMMSLANIYKRYQTTLEESGQYDFNDMILRTLQALQDQPELKFNLQERFQYILLDEFQDTNAVQFELVKTLADHPVHEGRPNIMAVGDDDQGIFAFQGADIGNMVNFLSAFNDVKIINLIENYRSHPDILHVAHNIADQIESRLSNNFDDINKNIIAAADNLPKDAMIARHEFNSAAAENGWIADSIAEKIKSGVPAHQIAILAPKHVILETLVPFLNSRNIPVSYEKRENIFETPIVQNILLISEFLQAASAQNVELMDELLPRVLSLDFWQIPTETIWRINWDHAANRYSDNRRWCDRAMDNNDLKEIVQFLLHIGVNSPTYGLELTLDYITGAASLNYDHQSFTSPLKNFYFSSEALNSSSLNFYEAISHLSVIRQQLREQQAREDDRLSIESLLNIYRTYQEAEQPLINTHPIAQAESAVQLQTVYKAKGLEYEYVYLPSMHDNIWGSTVSGGGNKIKLPDNLKHIRHDSSDEDSLRRLLFVAVTRAKHGLIATSHSQTESGKKNLPVKYMKETETEDNRTSQILPTKFADVIMTDRPTEQLRKDVDTLWHSRHSNLTPDLRSLLAERLKRYVMSPTHLNNFTNVEYSGPYEFLLNTLLRFPSAPTPDSVYGDALHRALEQYQKSWQNDPESGLTNQKTVDIFETRMAQSHISKTDKEIYINRGKRALNLFLKANQARLQSPAGIEVDFRRDGCVLDGAVLTGKIDRLEIDEKTKSLRIIDFKSGSPSSKWSSTSKHLAYKQQLYFYMLLIETSHRYKNYTVKSAALEFIEPLTSGEPSAPLELKFDDQEYQEFKHLVATVWRHIQDLNLPDISQYPTTVSGMRRFIQDIKDKRFQNSLK